MPSAPVPDNKTPKQRSLQALAMARKKPLIVVCAPRLRVVAVVVTVSTPSAIAN
jgi:hypothetical protein